MDTQPAEEVKHGDTEEQVPTDGILVINHAYNEGKITFQEWLQLTREWALKIKEQYGRAV